LKGPPSSWIRISFLSFFLFPFLLRPTRFLKPSDSPTTSDFSLYRGTVSPLTGSLFLLPSVFFFSWVFLSPNFFPVPIARGESQVNPHLASAIVYKGLRRFRGLLSPLFRLSSPPLLPLKRCGDPSGVFLSRIHEEISRRFLFLTEPQWQTFNSSPFFLSITCSVFPRASPLFLHTFAFSFLILKGRPFR